VCGIGLDDLRLRPDDVRLRGDNLKRGMLANPLPVLWDLPEVILFKPISGPDFLNARVQIAHFVLTIKPSSDRPRDAPGISSPASRAFLISAFFGIRLISINPCGIDASSVISTIVRGLVMLTVASGSVTLSVSA